MKGEWGKRRSPRSRGKIKGEIPLKERGADRDRAKGRSNPTPSAFFSSEGFEWSGAGAMKKEHCIALRARR